MWIKKRKQQDIQKSMLTEKTRTAKYKWKVKVKYNTRLTCCTQGLKKQQTMKKWSQKGDNDKQNKIYIGAKGSKRLDWKRHMVWKQNWEKKIP